MSLEVCHRCGCDFETRAIGSSEITIRERRTQGYVTMIRNLCPGCTKSQKVWWGVSDAIIGTSR